MIIVTITLASAVTKEITTLGVMTIANNGHPMSMQHHNYNSEIKHSPDCVDYAGVVYRKPDFKAETRHGHLFRWPRMSKTIWHLVARMLQDMGYTK